MASHKVKTREKRKASIRKKLSGTAERPRLSIFRSSKHVYAQVIDDVARTTLAAVSSLDEKLIEQLKGVKKSEKAKAIGKAIAERCHAKGINKVVFDRNGYIYHGRVLSLAQGAREGGLEF